MWLFDFSANFLKSESACYSSFAISLQRKFNQLLSFPVVENYGSL